MRARKMHRWDVTPAEARRIQEELRGRVVLEDQFATPIPSGKAPRRGEERDSKLEIRNSVRRVAGADVAFDFSKRGTRAGTAIAGVIVYAFPEMREIERAWAERPLEFPYVPGLLSFRELPALLAALERLQVEPDVIFCDAQGYAHPRRFGLACHLGVLLDRATIGCAKSRLIGEHKEPGRAAGSWTALVDTGGNMSRAYECRPRTWGRGYKGGEVIGAVVRTRAGVKPIYVSQGHRVSLESAIELVLAVCDGYRIPRPTREADCFVEQLKRRRTKG